MLGTVDGGAVNFYRKPLRRAAPDTEFDMTGRTTLPRVDIIPAYAGADALFVQAALQAGAKGLVSAGFPAGAPSPLQKTALEAAARAGTIVVQSSRAAGRIVADSLSLRRAGFIGADTLSPQKARILLMLALTLTADPDEIHRIFATY
jgi:L-asparaginase